MAGFWKARCAEPKTKHDRPLNSSINALTKGPRLLRYLPAVISMVLHLIDHGYRMIVWCLPSVQLRGSVEARPRI